MIHWQWVSAAFLVGLTLTLCLEIRRRQKLRPQPLLLYLLPLIPLVLAAGILLSGQKTAASPLETAVLSPVFPATANSPTAPSPQKNLPAPQISIVAREEESSAVPPSATTSAAPPQTTVHRLSIPALNLNKPVHTIPLEDGLWDVTDLGSDVGWLETTAVQPDDESAMVFVGHMTFANENLLEQGAFADIPTLAYGTAVILETTNNRHTYLVDSVRRVSPDDTDALYQESGDSILLLTCADWNPQSGSYENRLLVRASKPGKQ